MEKTIELTIEDRYRIMTYAHQIPSSAGVYLNFPAFVDKIGLTDDEEREYEVKVGADGVITSNSPDKVFTYKYSDFPEVVMSAIKGYVEDLTATMADLREANKANKDYTDSELYTNMVSYLGKLF